MDASEFKWKTLVENYEDFQNELDNTANGVDFLKELFLDFQKFEVKFFSLGQVALSHPDSMSLFKSSSNNYLLSFINGMNQKFKENSCLKNPANSGLITQVYRNSMSLFTRYAQIWLKIHFTILYVPYYV